MLELPLKIDFTGKTVPCWIFPVIPPPWKQAIMVARAVLSVGFKEYRIVLGSPPFSKHAFKRGASDSTPERLLTALNTAEDVALALGERIDYFADHGCLCADHGLDYCMYEKPDKMAANHAFAIAMEGKCPVLRFPNMHSKEAPVIPLRSGC